MERSRDVVVDDRSDPEAERPSTVWRTLGVMTMLAIALFWIWAFSRSVDQRDEPAGARNPDHLDDRGWVARAEATCARTMRGVDERSEAAGRQDRDARADAIDASNAELRTMLDQLRAPLPSGASDRDVVEEWLGDWGRLVDDRADYGDAIRRDPDARFLTEEKFRDPLDRVIEVFAEVNQMPSCAPAGDVG